MDNAWLAWREPAEQTGFRLFCLPYAGGGASAYRAWGDLASGRIQVCPLEVPGRGRRLAETPFNRLRPLVGALADALRAHLDRPFAIFGHSMGGLLAFELTRTLRRRGWPLPEHLFVSGAAPPDVPRTRPPVHAASDEEVKAELRRLGGTPGELLDDDEVMELMLPTLRADFSVLETYEYRAEPPLPVPMTVFGGTADPLVAPAALHGWRRQAGAGSRLELLPGGHFFLHPAAADVVTTVSGTLCPEVVT
ncbi:thioesterase II family protein [Streptomyces sp. NBC_01803]|uniref:thioesterase II family protein n=1 Tax=Streptomyces sp. NBC_01803 TaxID=2975946 RepID=UPI002DD95048|nr:alpha/beta fold hydrolase [Streptomyces sp. NBC_01803]WSA43058.1 alpha/beta fold hydrolase [Streptomyces sp. NBC_01803]